MRRSMTTMTEPTTHTLDVDGAITIVRRSLGT